MRLSSDTNSCIEIGYWSEQVFYEYCESLKMAKKDKDEGRKG